MIDRYTTDTGSTGMTAEELLDLIRRPAWWADAACRGVGVDVFIREKGGDHGPAMSYCERCPVTEECAAWAAQYPGTVGVWGGISGNGRRSFRSLNRRCQVCGDKITEARRISLCSTECEKESRRRNSRSWESRRGVAK